jgi:hypothetical protein
MFICVSEEREGQFAPPHLLICLLPTLFSIRPTGRRRRPANPSFSDAASSAPTAGKGKGGGKFQIKQNQPTGRRRIVGSRPATATATQKCDDDTTTYVGRQVAGQQQQQAEIGMGQLAVGQPQMEENISAFGIEQLEDEWAGECRMNESVDDRWPVNNYYNDL